MSRAALAALVVVATVLLRLPVLFCHVDTWFPFEVHSGNIALGLLDGLALDWAHLPIMPHIRGNVVFGLGQAATFSLLGPTALALKLVPVLWHAATLALATALVDRFWTRRAAVTTALLMLFAPPLITDLSTLGFASHLESTLPMLAALWPYLSITSRVGGTRAHRRRLFFLFGLALGFAGFFHLQALLPCLIMLGLLVIQEPRACFGRHGLVLLLGLALGAAPAWAFADGNIAYLQWSFAGSRGGQFETGPLAEHGAGRASPLTKLRALLSGDFLTIMGFAARDDGQGGVSASPAGAVYALLLLGAVGAAVWTRRRGLAAVLWRPLTLWRGTGEQVSRAAPLVLHPLLVLALALGAKARVNVELTGVGFENRRMAPLLFSLLVLAGLGLSAEGQQRLRRLVLVAMLGICAWAVAREALPSSRWPPMQDGAALEWFTLQLHHDAGHDLLDMADTLARIDRGDARFRTLRFRPPYARETLDSPAVLPAEAAIRGRMPPALAAWRATALGRVLGRHPRSLTTADLARHFLSLPVPEREALMHGFGLGFITPRPTDRPGRLAQTLTTMRKLFATLPGRAGEAAAEGLGFAQGSTYDPYNEFRGAFLPRLIDTLSDAQRSAFARGFGWGYRQRFGRHVPADLSRQKVLRHIPFALRDAFREGYHELVLPREADLPWPEPR